jgi:hypothetical protein
MRNVRLPPQSTITVPDGDTVPPWPDVTKIGYWTSAEPRLDRVRLVDVDEPVGRLRPLRHAVHDDVVDRVAVVRGDVEPLEVTACDRKPGPEGEIEPPVPAVAVIVFAQVRSDILRVRACHERGHRAQGQRRERAATRDGAADTWSDVGAGTTGQGTAKAHEHPARQGKYPRAKGSFAAGGVAGFSGRESCCGAAQAYPTATRDPPRKCRDRQGRAAPGSRARLAPITRAP